LFGFRVDLAGSAEGPPPGADRSAPRLLFVALDAVSFEIVQDVVEGSAERGRLFAGFKPPAALVSSFPSTTSPALSGILGAFGVEAAPGYESRFFDRDRNKVRGGTSLSYTRISFGWRDFVDYRRKSLILRGVNKLRPIQGSLGELRNGLEAFLRSDQQTFFVYSALTDAAGHLRSPSSSAHVLSELDAMLHEVRERHPAPFYTVIFSDHGMAGGSPLVNVRSALRGALKQAGWRVRERLEQPNDVVFAPFGLVSSLEVFTWPRREREVASLLASVAGVDLCLIRGELGWRVLSRRGDALIGRAQPTDDLPSLWSYRPVDGDPLDYQPVIERMRERSSRDEATWFTAGEWLEATYETRYPDALHRAARAFNLVRNPASAVCSLEPGYMHGSRPTGVAAKLSIGHLSWTHGAMTREASLGFLLTDDPEWPQTPVVRFDEALRYFSRTVADVDRLDDAERPIATLRSTDRPLQTAASESSPPGLVPPP
jgi:hypothetical protein